MTYYLVKIVTTTALVITISEIAKRSTLIGAIVASIPLISVLAMFWLYLETQDTTKVIRLSNSIFWLILPSLVLFITLPALLNKGINFFASITLSIVATIICYFFMLLLLHLFGIKL